MKYPATNGNTSYTEDIMGSAVAVSTGQGRGEIWIFLQTQLCGVMKDTGILQLNAIWAYRALAACRSRLPRWDTESSSAQAVLRQLHVPEEAVGGWFAHARRVREWRKGWISPSFVAAVPQSCCCGHQVKPGLCRLEPEQNGNGVAQSLRHSSIKMVSQRT